MVDADRTKLVQVHTLTLIEMHATNARRLLCMRDQFGAEAAAAPGLVLAGGDDPLARRNLHAAAEQKSPADSLRQQAANAHGQAMAEIRKMIQQAHGLASFMQAPPGAGEQDASDQTTNGTH